MIEQRARQFADKRRNKRIQIGIPSGKLYAPLLLVFCDDFAVEGCSAGEIMLTTVKEHRSNFDSIQTVLLSTGCSDAQDKVGCACRELFKRQGYDAYNFAIVDIVLSADKTDASVINEIKSAAHSALRHLISVSSVRFNIFTVLRTGPEKLDRINSYFASLDSIISEPDNVGRMSSFVVGDTLNSTGQPIEDENNIYKAVASLVIYTNYNADSINNHTPGHCVTGYAQADIKTDVVYNIGFSAFSKRLERVLIGQKVADPPDGGFDFGKSMLLNEKLRVLDASISSLTSGAKMLYTDGKKVAGFISTATNLPAYQKLLSVYFDINLKRMCPMVPKVAMAVRLSERVEETIRRAGIAHTKELLEAYVSKNADAKTKLDGYAQIPTSAAKDAVQGAGAYARGRWQRIFEAQWLEVCSEYLEKDIFKQKENIARSVSEKANNIFIEISRLHHNSMSLASEVEREFDEFAGVNRAVLMFGYSDAVDYTNKALDLYEETILKRMLSAEISYKDEIRPMDGNDFARWFSNFKAEADISTRLCVTPGHGNVSEKYVILADDANDIDPRITNGFNAHGLIELGGVCVLRVLHFTTINNAKEIFMLSQYGQ